MAGPANTPQTLRKHYIWCGSVMQQILFAGGLQLCEPYIWSDGVCNRYHMYVATIIGGVATLILFSEWHTAVVARTLYLVQWCDATDIICKLQQ